MQEARLKVWETLWEKYHTEPEDKPVSVVVKCAKGEFAMTCSAKDHPMSLLKVIPEGEKQKLAKLIGFPSNSIACILDETDAANPVVKDACQPFVNDCTFRYCPIESDEGHEVFLHSSAHVLGAVMERDFGGKLTHGPALSKEKRHTAGFFYDAKTETTISSAEEDLEAIAIKALALAQDVPVPGDDDEKKKKKGQAGLGSGKGHAFQRIMVTKADVLALFEGNELKQELIEGLLAEDELCSLYRCGPFVDFCRGPHLPNTNLIKAFNVVSASQAYFKGDQKRDSLQRIYGMACPSVQALKEWKKRKDEIAEIDHRRLGAKQKLFFFHEYSPGCSFFEKHGTRIYNKLVELMRHEYHQRGYEEVITPNMLNCELWKTSGHYQHYKDDMFTLEVDGAEYALKPMNCPCHCLMFNHENHSYRDLPIRMADFGAIHRDEASGALTGLSRVRKFHQDDAHIFCRQDQIQAEIYGVIDFIKFVYDKVLGMPYKFNLSTRPEKAMGARETWDSAESQLKAALADAGVEYTIAEGDGAFYGPKIDITTIDILGREVQCATIQLDYQLPKSFELKYNDPNDPDARPVMVHRAILGSVERMMSMLIERFKGKWPFWLNPRQIMLLPCAATVKEEEIADPDARRAETERRQAVVDAATDKMYDDLKKKGYYVDVDQTKATLKKRMHEAASDAKSYNYVVIYGYAELTASEGDDFHLRVRRRGENSKNGVPMTFGEFTAQCGELVETFDRADVPQ